MLKFFRSHKGFDTSLHPDWTHLRLKKNTFIKGKKVLIATSVGGLYNITPVESLLAVALDQRGSEVSFLLCDGILPGCMDAQIDRKALGENESIRSKEFIANGPQGRLCQSCFEPANNAYRVLGYPVLKYSDFISQNEKSLAENLADMTPFEEIQNLVLDQIPVGEQAMAGALRFFARGNLEGEPNGEAVLRRYLKASLITQTVMENLFRKNNFDVACFHHGIYVPQGLIGEVARKRKVRVVNWAPAYRKQCFYFSHNETYHHALMTEPTSNWEDIPWTQKNRTEIKDYLKSRWHGTKDWLWYHHKPENDPIKISKELKIDEKKPCIGMLTNVIWDAQLHYPSNAFESQMDWVIETIQYFIERQDLQLLLRVHPAEIRGTLRSRQPICDEIRKVFSKLPKNIFIVPPEKNVGTYALMKLCDSAIIYGTKTGVELTSMGIPVIVAGEAWIRGKGLTTDIHSKDQYRTVLDNLPIGNRLDSKIKTRSLKYAYHFFFRRMIPLKNIVQKEGWPPYKINVQSINDLTHGKDKGLDVVCKGILDGSEFIFHYENNKEERKKTKIIWLIEHVSREMDVATLVQHLADEKPELDISIKHIYFDSKKLLKAEKPDLVILPYFYSANDLALQDYLSAWPDATFLNLAWEQIFYNAHIKIKSPKDSWARNEIIHHAWSQKYKDYLISYGVSEKNILLNGNPAFGLYRPPYCKNTPSREALAKEYGLDSNKKWVLVPENYRWAFYDDREIEVLGSQGASEPELNEMKEHSKKSMSVLFYWCNQIAMSQEVEIIFRPKPINILSDINNLLQTSVKEISNHFHIIKDRPVRHWILASDLIVSNLSSTLIEASLAEKPVYRIEPLKSLTSFASEWHSMLPKIDSLGSFESAVELPKPTKELRLWAIEHFFNSEPGREDAIKGLLNIIETLSQNPRPLSKTAEAKTLIKNSSPLAFGSSMAKKLENKNVVQVLRSAFRLGEKLSKKLYHYNRPYYTELPTHRGDFFTENQVKNKVKLWEKNL